MIDNLLTFFLIFFLNDLLPIITTLLVQAHVRVVTSVGVTKRGEENLAVIRMKQLYDPSIMICPFHSCF